MRGILMISVSNSYKKRLFLKLRSNIASKRKEEVEKLKYEIEEEICKIELQDDINKRDYSSLCNKFNNRDNNEMISLFYYKEEIGSALKDLKRIFTEDTYTNKDRTIPKKYSDEEDYDAFIKEFKSLKENLFRILVGDFKTIKKYIENNSSSVLIYRGKPEEGTVLYKKYKEVFEDLYNDNLSGDKKFKKSFFKLFDNMNVCPYCNRNYVNPIYKKEKALKVEDETRKDNFSQSPDIEHFFPKSMYPFLSLSISNLLPSCGFCNKIKSNVDTMKNFKSPYEIESKDFKFKFELKEVNKIKIKIEGGSEVERNIEVLDLENMYNIAHSNFIDEVFWDVRKYPKQNQEFLESFNVSTEEIMDMKYKEKFRNYFKEDEFNKQPLSKMTKDLFMQIKEDEE